MHPFVARDKSCNGIAWEFEDNVGWPHCKEAIRTGARKVTNYATATDPRGIHRARGDISVDVDVSVAVCGTDGR